MRSNKMVLGLVALLLAGSVVAACGSGSEDPVEQSVSVDGETLLQERCTECHGLDRVTAAEKTGEEWEDTVTRMVNRGATLDEAEETVLVDYLAETYGP